MVYYTLNAVCVMGLNSIFRAEGASKL